MKNDVQDIIGMIRFGHLSRTGRGLTERLRDGERSLSRMLDGTARGPINTLLLLAWQMGYRI
jgi:hypothetical protein